MDISPQTLYGYRSSLLSLFFYWFITSLKNWNLMSTMMMMIKMRSINSRIIIIASSKFFRCLYLFQTEKNEIWELNDATKTKTMFKVYTFFLFCFCCWMDFFSPFSPVHFIIIIKFFFIFFCILNGEYDEWTFVILQR